MKNVMKNKHKQNQILYYMLEMNLVKITRFKNSNSSEKGKHNNKNAK